MELKIVDAWGIELTPEETETFIEDLWDLGIPPDPPSGIDVLRERWGHRMAIPKRDELTLDT